MMSNPELAEKLGKSASFRKEMEKTDHNYRMLCQQAHYSDLSSIEEKLLSKFDHHKNGFDVFFFYEMFQLEGPKTILYFVNKLPR